MYYIVEKMNSTISKRTKHQSSSITAQKDMIVSPFTKQNQDNLNFLNFACKTLQLLMQEGTLTSFFYTPSSIQYCMEENSSSGEVLGKKKQVHTDLKSLFGGKKSMSGGLLACSFRPPRESPPLHAPLGLEGVLGRELLGQFQCRRGTVIYR